MEMAANRLRLEMLVILAKGQVENEAACPLPNP
jgi:hypothetical protein